MASENMTPQDYIGHHLNNLQLDLRTFSLVDPEFLNGFEQLPDGFVVESIEKLQIPQLEGERHLVIIKPNTF